MINTHTRAEAKLSHYYTLSLHNKHMVDGGQIKSKKFYTHGEKSSIVAKWGPTI